MELLKGHPRHAAVLKLAAEGHDAAEALDALRGLVERRFGEDE